VPVVVSTHLDDAVLSCYSLLGPDTRVVTVLAGVPPAGSGVIGDWDRDGRASASHERVIERRAEDVRALAASGAVPVHLDFFDSPYWPLLGEPDRATIAAGLEPLLSGTIYAPAGIGNTDHALVRDAVLAVRPDAALYDDLPYALRHGFSAEGRDVELDDATVAEKLTATQCYTTQLEQLVNGFGDFLTADALRRERLTDRR